MKLSSQKKLQKNETQRDLELNKFEFLINNIIFMTITIKTRRLRVNKLLARKELLLDVYHEGKPNVSQKDLKELIANKYKWDIKNLVLFGFRTAFGGNRSTGFCLAYDNQQYIVKYEPNYRLRRLAVLPKKNPKRKAEK
jgi:small subunit ribosomal protein S24e